MLRVKDIDWAGAQLHLNCGDKHLPSPWINADSTDPASDVLIDISRRLDGIPNESVGWIYWSHGPEHVFPDLLPGILAEFARVLRPNGILTLSTISLPRVFRSCYSHGDPHVNWNALLYGNTKSTDAPSTAHRQCFDYSSLVALLHTAGFRGVREWEPYQYREIEALIDESSTAAPYSVFIEGIR